MLFTHAQGKNRQNINGTAVSISTLTRKEEDARIDSKGIVQWPTEGE